MEEPSQSAQPQLCRNGCGFYGSAQTEGMCSKCYKEKVQKSNNSGKKSPSAHSIVPPRSEMANSSKSNECPVSSEMASLATSDSHNGVSSAKSSMSASAISTNNISLSTSPTLQASSSPARDEEMSNAASTSSSSSAPSRNEDSPSKPKKSRCATCRKRVGLTGFSCRCGKIFCGLHRYSDEHNCEYDYKADAQANIRKENPVVVGEKIKKI